MNKAKFNSLSPELQKVITDAAAEAQKYNFENAESMNNALRQQVVDAGVKFYTPTADEQKLWEEAGKKVWDEYSTDVPKDLIERVQKAQL
jgi:TRAP-type C4-dicarboxylate transport system substrate-binding protein